MHRVVATPEVSKGDVPCLLYAQLYVQSPGKQRGVNNAALCVCPQMATLEKAEALLEELRGASCDAAVKELEEVRAFAAENVRTMLPPLAPDHGIFSGV